MNKVDVIIYTKDRPAQLDLLLRSIKDKFKNVGGIGILWDYSTESFKEGYNKVIDKEYDLPIFYIKQTNFEEDTETMISEMSSPYFLGLCDDDVFIKEMDCSKIVNKLYEENVSSISIKHGLDIICSYPDDRTELPYPNFIEKESFLKWEWRKYPIYSTWGYPTCINSYIYLKDYFLDLISNFHFNFPPNLEGGLNTNKEKFKKYIVSFKELKLMNLPINRIQTYSLCNPFSKKYSYPIEELNKKFLEGYVISTENIYNMKVNKSNDEVEFIYEKE